jgi:hypothetical protein
MSLIDDASRALAPHTAAVVETLNRHGENIAERVGDLGRPDTGDQFYSIIRNGKIEGEQNLTESRAPEQGEIWLIQCICANGEVLKSPAFAVRTNTGRLIFAMPKEAVNTQQPGGDIPLLPGETLLFQPHAGGEFDFTITVVMRKAPRPPADAGFGISGEEYTPHNPHEPGRDMVEAHDPTEL